MGYGMEIPPIHFGWDLPPDPLPRLAPLLPPAPHFISLLTREERGKRHRKTPFLRFRCRVAHHCAVGRDLRKVKRAGGGRAASEAAPLPVPSPRFVLAILDLTRPLF